MSKEFIPAIRGERFIPEYYRARKDIISYLDPSVCLIDARADASAVIAAFDIKSHPLAEIICKVIRINHRHEYDPEGQKKQIAKDCAEIMEHITTFVFLNRIGQDG